MAFKDCRILKLDRVAEQLPETMLQQTAFLSLLRDPRGVVEFAARREFAATWAVTHIGILSYVCSALRLQYFTESYSRFALSSVKKPGAHMSGTWSAAAASFLALG